MADDGGAYKYAGRAFFYDAATLRINQPEQNGKTGDAASILPANAKTF